MKCSLLLELAAAHTYRELIGLFSSFSRNLKTGLLSPDSSVNWVKLQNWDFSRETRLQILSRKKSSLHRALKAATSSGLPRGSWPLVPDPELPGRQHPDRGWHWATSRRLSQRTGSWASQGPYLHLASSSLRLTAFRQPFLHFFLARESGEAPGLLFH